LLRRTPLVRLLAERGKIPPGDLLARDFGVVMLANTQDYKFRTLLRLPELVGELSKEIGPRQRPDFTRRLTEIYRHIRERTGHWHDEKVADILYDLTPDPKHPPSAESLKVWRNEHGLSG
jgi:hypothetical protein